MHTRQWKATWTEQDGTQHEYIFTTDDNRVIAGIDFRMRLMDQGKPVPAFFELEEGRQVIQVVPSLKELVERGELRR